MNHKIRIISLLLAIFACLSLSACGKNSDIPDDDSNGDDYSGSISKDEEKEDEGGEPTPPKDDGDPDSVITITTADELRSMKRKGTYILGADIDLSGTAWSPVGTYGVPFVGKFDGAGHRITGLTINSAESDNGESISYTYSYYGLFGVTNGAEIKGLTIEGATVSADSNSVFHNVYAGILAGLMIDTTVTDCSFSGSVTAVSSNCLAAAGGVAGMSNSSVLSSCVSYATVKTENSPVRAISGGILGYSRLGTKLEKCSTSAEVSAVSTIGVAYAGGIAGYCYTTEMYLCSSDSTVSSRVTLASPGTGTKGAAYSGGIAAVSSASASESPSVFTKCYSTDAKISAYSTDNSVYVAGLCAESDYTNFVQCYSRASLEAESLNETAHAGGLSGVLTKLCSMNGCFFSGSITVNANDYITGTLTSSTLDGESEVVTYCAFRSDTAFVINGVSYTKSTNEDIRVHGDSRASNVFSSLSLLCSALGWNISEWEMISGAPIPKAK